MTTSLKVLYIGGAALALVALFIGSYGYFVTAADSRNLVYDVLVPLGAFVVIVLLYRRRQADLQGGSPLR